MRPQAMDGAAVNEFLKLIHPRKQGFHYEQNFARDQKVDHGKKVFTSA